MWLPQKIDGSKSGISHLEIDDDWGYPHWWKPPYEPWFFRSWMDDWMTQKIHGLTVYGLWSSIMDLGYRKKNYKSIDFIHYQLMYICFKFLIIDLFSIIYNHVTVHNSSWLSLIGYFCPPVHGTARWRVQAFLHGRFVVSPAASQVAGSFWS